MPEPSWGTDGGRLSAAAPKSDAGDAGKQGAPLRYGRALNGVAASLILGAVVWDLMAGVAPLPPWWPTVSYVALAAAVAVGCVALLVELFSRRRGEPRPRGSVMRLLAIGLVLAAWLLRGHPEIPPDPPLVAASAVAGLLFAASRIRLRSPARVRRPPGSHRAPTSLD